jgi:hypothetical protein
MTDRGFSATGRRRAVGEGAVSMSMSEASVHTLDAYRRGLGLVVCLAECTRICGIWGARWKPLPALG